MPTYDTPFNKARTNIEETRKAAAEQVQADIRAAKEGDDTNWGAWLGGLAGMLMGIPSGGLSLAAIPGMMAGASAGLTLGDAGQSLVEGDFTTADAANALSVGGKLASPKGPKKGPKVVPKKSKTY